MYKIARSAWVMHNAENMYLLVNDIESYPMFLPWCSGAQVVEHREGGMIAQVQVSFRGLKQSFTTHNRLTPFESISMTLVDGSFSELSGLWEFKSLREDACKISFHLQFDFSNVVVAKIAGPVYKYIADSIIDSFVARAKQVYGSSKRLSSDECGG